MRQKTTTATTTLAALVLLAGAAHAQLSSQTYVSGVGDDANPCSRVAPCATFAGALKLTAPGGEIDALDPGEFGPLAITQAITIDGNPQRAGILAVAADAITVAASAGDSVVLRNLRLLGDGTHAGIKLVSAGQLRIDDCEIAAFATGLDAEPAAGGAVLANRLSIFASGIGVLGGAGGSAPTFVTVAEIHAENNGVGISAIAGGRISVYDSEASGNTTGVLASTSAPGVVAEINLESVAVTNNGVGVQSMGAGGSPLVRMSQVLGTGNPGGPFAVSGVGAIQSFGNNRLDVTPSLTLSSTATTQTVTSGGAASYPLAVVATGLFASPIGFQCSGLPFGAACAFTPTTLPGGATSGGTLTLTVSTGPTMIGRAPSPRDPFAALAALPLVAWLGAGRRRRRGAGLLLAMALMVASCNEDTGAADAGADLAGDLSVPSDLAPPADLRTLTGPGTYPFQVTAVSGTLSSAPLTLTLVVQ